MCCSPWGRKESDTTERLNWTELNSYTSLKYVKLRVWSAQGLGYAFVSFLGGPEVSPSFKISILRDPGQLGVIEAFSGTFLMSSRSFRVKKPSLDNLLSPLCG